MLAIGIDPRSEAAAVMTRMEAAGYTLAERIEGRTFVAASFARRDGATSVRIVTKAGIALTIDAPREETALRAVGLSAVETRDHDLDGDGFEEVLLTLLDGRVRGCIGVLRVLPTGRVVEVPIEGVDESDVCLEDVVVVGGRAEGHVVLREAAFGLEPPPTVTLPIVARGGRWGRAPSSRAETFFEREIRRRDAHLDEARGREDAEVALRIGVELAMLAKERGEDLEAQRARLDEALRGIVLTPELAERHRQVREHFGSSSAAGELE